MDPRISVVMGVYNAQRFVAQTIVSVLAQTFSDFEFVIVDDGSTDGSLSILRDFEKGDPRIRVISRPNTGIVGAANDGITAARGRYIARHDADDLSHPQRFERQVAFLDANPQVVAVGSRMELIDPYGSPLGQTNQPLEHERIEAEMLLGSGWALCQPTVMMRHDAFERAGRYREQYQWSEDLDLFLRMAQIGKVANLPDLLLKWRRHLSSVNHQHHQRQWANKRKIVEEAYAARGTPPPRNLELRYNAHLAPWKQLCQWGWKALRHGNTSIARRHAWAALRRRPLGIEVWRLVACALRGR